MKFNATDSGARMSQQSLQLEPYDSAIPWPVKDCVGNMCCQTPRDIAIDAIASDGARGFVDAIADTDDERLDHLVEAINEHADEALKAQILNLLEGLLINQLETTE